MGQSILCAFLAYFLLGASALFSSGCYNPYETDTGNCCNKGYYCNDDGKCWRICQTDIDCQQGYECDEENLCRPEPGWVPPDDEDESDASVSDSGTDSGQATGQDSSIDAG